MEKYLDSYEKDEQGLEFLLNHIKIVCNNEVIIYEWFLKWISHTIKYPNLKNGKVPVIIGKQGSGKTTIYLLLRKMFGEKNVLKQKNQIQLYLVISIL